MHFRKSASRRIRRWRTATPNSPAAPTVRRLGSGFFECVIHRRGRIFRGLANESSEARNRAETLAAGTRNLAQ